jgi:hypothetical protein
MDLVVHVPHKYLSFLLVYKLDKKFKFSENVIFFNENELTHISYIKHNLVIYQLKKDSLN